MVPQYIPYQLTHVPLARNWHTLCCRRNTKSRQTFTTCVDHPFFDSQHALDAESPATELGDKCPPPCGWSFHCAKRELPVRATLTPRW